MDVWLPMLGDIADEIGKGAVIQLCSSGQWPPTIAEIRDTALSVSEGDVVAPPAWEAWERALEGRVGCPMEARVLRLIGGTWEIKHTNNIGVTRSNYIKAYNDIATAERQRRLALPSVSRLALSHRQESPGQIKIIDTDTDADADDEIRRPTPQELTDLLAGLVGRVSTDG